MSYFSKFPTDIYDLTAPNAVQPYYIVTRDIVRRVKLKDKLLSNVFAYDEYDIQEGERPDILADQFYGDSNLAWIILLTNEIHDIHEEWPKTERELRKSIAAKYTNVYDVHHYEKPQTSGNTTVYVRCNSTDTGAVAITNQVYEQRKNEEKRRIKVLRRELVQEFIEEFGNLIGE